MWLKHQSEIHNIGTGLEYSFTQYISKYILNCSIVSSLCHNVIEYTLTIGILTVQFAESRVKFVQTQTAVFIHVFKADHVRHNTNVRYITKLVLLGNLKKNCIPEIGSISFVCAFSNYLGFVCCFVFFMIYLYCTSYLYINLKSNSRFYCSN